MRESVLLLLVVALAFMVGFAVRRGGLCAVAAVSQAVAHRRTTRIRMFLVAAAWSGVLIVPLAWLLPSSVSLSPGYPISGAVLFGGALFGLGAYVNGACALGTLAHLSGGETNYAGTVVGVLMGAAASRALAPVEVSAPAPSPLSEPSWIGYLFFALFAALALQAAWRRRRPALERVRAKTSFMITRRWRPATAMVVVAVAGGVLHSVAGEWTYMAGLSNRATELVGARTPGTSSSAAVSSLALLVGGISAALLSGKFAFVAPRLALFAQRTLGGAMMGFAAAIIPGGNGTLLVYGLPSLAPHAVAAYAAMITTLVGLFLMKRAVAKSEKSERLLVRAKAALCRRCPAGCPTPGPGRNKARSRQNSLTRKSVA